MHYVCNILKLCNLATGTEYFYAFLNYTLLLRVHYFGHCIQQMLSKQTLKEVALN